jgi:hypothetical protein
MDEGLLTASVAGCAALLVVLVAVLAATLRSGRRTRGRLDASQADLADLRAEVEALRRAETSRADAAAGRSEEFVITTLGDRPGDAVAVPQDAAPAEQLTAGQFASVAVGESLVRLVSLAYGVRRALSAENRNRIRFEMRREVKRARKQRRRDLKEAKRHLRAEHDDVGRRAA